MLLNKFFCIFLRIWAPALRFLFNSFEYNKDWLNHKTNECEGGERERRIKSENDFHCHRHWVVQLHSTHYSGVVDDRCKWNEKQQQQRKKIEIKIHAIKRSSILCLVLALRVHRILRVCRCYGSVVCVCVCEVVMLFRRIRSFDRSSHRIWNNRHPAVRFLFKFSRSFFFCCFCFGVLF